MLESCPVTGEKLGSMGDAVNYVHEGRLIRFCCKGCIEKFTKDPQKYLRILDKAEIAKNAHSYPLETCLVTGEKLGSMGDAYVFDHKGREIIFCCKRCVKKFEADPDTYVEKLDAEIIKLQGKNYPLKYCVVSNEAFGSEMGEPIDLVHKNRLVRLCCKMCKKSFNKDPNHYLEKLDDALVAVKYGENPNKVYEKKEEGREKGDSHRHD